MTSSGSDGSNAVVLIYQLKHPQNAMTPPSQDNVIKQGGYWISTLVRGDKGNTTVSNCAKALFENKYQPTMNVNGYSFGALSYGKSGFEWGRPTAFFSGVEFVFSDNKQSFSSANIQYSNNLLTGYSTLTSQAKNLFYSWSLDKWYSELHTCGAF